MVRIIKEARVKEHRVVCESCGRTIVYVNNDIKEYHGRDISGGSDGHKWVDCPGEDCGKRIILESW